MWKSLTLLSSLLAGTFQAMENDNLIPDNIRNLVLPDPITRQEVNGHEYVDIPIPEGTKVLLTKDPANYLYGSCLQLYLGYHDGLRLHDLAEFLGPEMHDAMIEFTVFDFLTGNCKWVKRAWGQIIDGWTYVDYDDPDNIFYRERRDTMGTIIEWFAWWIEREDNLQYTIYPDGLIAWKIKMAEEFLSLKQMGDELVQDPPNVDMLKSGKEAPKKQRGTRRLLAEKLKTNEDENAEDGEEGWVPQNDDDYDDDEEENVMCDRLCPVAFFAHKYEFILKYFLMWIGHDINHHHGHLALDGWYAKLTLWVEGCAGVCLRIGTGLRYNPVLGDVCIDQSYGIGSKVDVSRSAAVRAEGSFFCGSIFGMDETFGGSIVTKDDQEYKLLYSNNWEKFLGLSFTVPYDGRYTYNHHYDKFNFHYTKSGPIACRHHDRFVSTDLLEAFQMQEALEGVEAEAMQADLVKEQLSLEKLEVDEETKERFRKKYAMRVSAAGVQGGDKRNKNMRIGTGKAQLDGDSNDFNGNKLFLVALIAIAVVAVVGWMGFFVYRHLCVKRKDESEPLLVNHSSSYAAYA